MTNDNDLFIFTTEQVIEIPTTTQRETLSIDLHRDPSWNSIYQNATQSSTIRAIATKE